MSLAYTADAWTEAIVALSIFGPVAVAIVITIVVLRGKKNDPDEQRMRADQRAYEERKRAETARKD